MKSWNFAKSRYLAKIWMLHYSHWHRKVNMNLTNNKLVAKLESIIYIKEIQWIANVTYFSFDDLALIIIYKLH